MNVLSIPTWIIHVSSVLEWAIAMWLIWSYAKIQPQYAYAWKGLALAMLPALVSAMCACTWHFFDNSGYLEWLVTVQAATTLFGNCTLAIAGYFLYKTRNTEAT
jgi:hypothetical protein